MAANSDVIPSTWQPKLHPPPDRRHSSAHTAYGPSSPMTSRRPSATSSTAGNGSAGRKRSDGSTPSWLTAMQERDGDRSTPQRRKSSISSLFSRRKSTDDHDAKPKQKTILTSRHAGQVKNVLKSDPRGARKHPSTGGGAAPARVNEGVQHYSHLSAVEQEMRHPHSGPPTLHGTDGGMLARIVSVDEPPEPVSEEPADGVGGLVFTNKADDASRSTSMLERVNETPRQESSAEAQMQLQNGFASSPLPQTSNQTPTTPEPQKRHTSLPHEGTSTPVSPSSPQSPTSNADDPATDTRPRRKSLLDVEIRGADEPRRRSSGNRVKLVFGGWHRDDKGNWTRK